MKTEHKIIGAVGVLAVLGGLLFVTRSKSNAEKEAQTQQAERPSFELKPEETSKITKLELESGDKDKRQKVVLEKAGDVWSITSPIQAKANQKDAADLVASLEKLKITDQIDSGTGTYGEYDLVDGKGVHFVAYKGGEKRIDVVFGKSGGRGQTVRVTGRDGVFTVPKDEYKSMLFSKDAKGWRDKLMLELKDSEVASIEVENAHGKYTFTRDGDGWSGAVVRAAEPAKAEGDKKPEDDKKPEGDKKAEGDKKPDAKKDDKKPEGDKKAEGDKKPDAKKDDKKPEGDKKPDAKKDDKKPEGEKPDATPKNPGWEAFDGKNIDTMIGAFRKLNAHDFADKEDSLASTGLEAAAKEGGVVTFKMKDGSEIKLLIGKKQKGSARFAKLADSELIFVVAGFVGDWAAAAPVKFEKDAGNDDDDGGEPHGGAHGGLPPGLEIPGLEE